MLDASPAVGISGGGVFCKRLSHSDEVERENAGRADWAVSAGAESSCVISGGVKGVISSGLSAGVVLSDDVVADVVNRVPQLAHASAFCGFMVPHIGQRTSVEGAKRAAQFLQNLLVGLLGVPHCGQ